MAGLSPRLVLTYLLIIETWVCSYDSLSRKVRLTRSTVALTLDGADNYLATVEYLPSTRNLDTF
jgi:hypothetical protein